MTDQKPAILVLSTAIAMGIGNGLPEFDLLVGEDEDKRSAIIAENAGRILGIAMIGREAVSDELLDKLPALRQIAVLGAGYEGVDVEAAAARNIAMTAAGADLPEDIADHTVALWLAVRKKIIPNDQWVRSGEWQGVIAPIGRSVAQERIGIIGMGRIGQAIAERIAPMCANIGWWGPNAKPDLPWPRHDSIMALAEWSTTLILAAKGDESTRGLIDGATLYALGSEGLFINIARGFMVDEDAMIAALKDKSLGHVALDVFDPEPADPARWADVPNALLSPHLAGYTIERMEAAKQRMLANLRDLLN